MAVASRKEGVKYVESKDWSQAEGMGLPLVGLVVVVVGRVTPTQPPC